MAGNKKRGKRPSNKVDDLAIAERELSKGNAKIAVKHARLAYRRDPSEPTTSLLRQTLLHRTRDLYNRKMHEPARAILAELNSVAGDDSIEVAELRRFNVLLGVGDVQSNAKVLTTDPALLGQLIDVAVRDGETRACPTPIIAEVQQVRQALEAVAEGRDDEATQSLQAIGRSSPLADWKLLTRGLIAFYADDAERRDANWSRLDNGRLPFRIARSIEIAISPTPGRQGEEETDAYRLRAARNGLDAPLARNLRQLQMALQQGGRWASSYSNLKSEFGKSHPDVLERVSEILVSKFVADCNYHEFERLQKLNPPFRLDPRMSRATALLRESDHDIDEAIDFWNQYINDLDHSEHLNESQRETAIALVNLHLARLSRTEASKIEKEEDDPYWGEPSGETNDELATEYRQAADAYFTNARKRDPRLKAAYAEQCGLLDEWGQTSCASRLYEEYAAKFEDDFDVQMATANHFRLAARDLTKAQHYARQAEKFRPRDEHVAQLLWDSGFDAARIAARAKHFGVARAELDQAEQYAGPGRELYVVDAMRAAVELKAGNKQGANRYQEQARTQTELAPAAALAYCANALQCGVSNPTRSELNIELKAASSAQPNSNAGGAMARFINSLSAADVDYHGLKTHEKLVSTYLKKCPKQGWSESDLIDAVEFAIGRDEPIALLKSLSKIGCKRFPANPQFWLGMGIYEMSRGPTRCNRRKATKFFRTAIERNSDADAYLLDATKLESASRAIEILEMPPPTHRFGGLGPPPSADLAEWQNEVGMPAELREMMDELGISIEDMIESAMSGESPDKFFKRHRGKRD